MAAHQLVAVATAHGDVEKMPSDIVAAISELDDRDKLNDASASQIAQLWATAAAKGSYQKNLVDPKQWMLDQMPFYLDNVTRFAKPDFKPSDSDIVFTRVITVGTKSVQFSDAVDGAFLVQYLPAATQLISPDEIATQGLCSLPWEIIDVGGQRNERRKWFHVLDDVM